MPLAELPACIFCGEPIGPGEETAGRMPAHAACADAALADDAHWDAIHAATGGGDEADDAAGSGEPPPATASRAGCLTVSALVLLAVALVLLYL